MTPLKTTLTGSLIGFGGTVTHAMNEIEGFVPCGNPAAMVTKGLVLLGSEADDALFQKQITITQNFIEHVSDHRGVPAHAVADASALMPEQNALLDDLVEVARAMESVDEHHPEVFEWVYRSLASLEPGSTESFSELAARGDEVKQHARDLATL